MDISDIKAAVLSCDYVLMTQHELPIDPIKTIQKKGWRLDPYSFIAKQGILPLNALLNISYDAFTLYMPESDEYAIAYNDNLPLPRIRFSLAHETAHIALKHFNDSSAIVLNFRESYLHLDRKQLPKIERAADIFAANFLSPAPLLEMCNFTCTEICKIFGVSWSAAEYIKNSARLDSQFIDENTKKQLKERFSPQLRQYYFSIA